MPFGVRSSLVIAFLCSTVAVHAADGSTWTDPPPRPPETAKAAPAAPAPQAAAPDTPAALSESARTSPRVQRRKVAAQKRLAAQPRRVVVAHTIRRPARIVTLQAMRPAPRRSAYRVYSQAGVPVDYDDPRFDRLGSAVGSGYLVMHRRTVEYPDGRMIRYYRPVESDSDE
ncbi:hypothetical protein [Methylobacterium sp. NFXW15]|uniref:hypothetical protein n=1 Tax=Methylobacterium sp. NFXW15 TaxID=2819512 RepID=UPI003CF56B32